MRDALNFNFLPIVQDEMNGLAVRTCVKGYAANISNGYYGYQPVGEKGEQRREEQMEVVESDKTQRANRKRACWDCGDAAALKKRRENDVAHFRGTKQKRWDLVFCDGSRESSEFLEELLRGTHGSDLYNWTGDDL